MPPATLPPELSLFSPEVPRSWTGTPELLPVAVPADPPPDVDVFQTHVEDPEAWAPDWAQNRPLHPPLLGPDLPVTLTALETIPVEPTPHTQEVGYTQWDGDMVEPAILAMTAALLVRDLIREVPRMLNPVSQPERSAMTEEIAILWYPRQGPGKGAVSHIEISNGRLVVNASRNKRQGTLAYVREKAQKPGRKGFVEITLAVTPEEKETITRNMQSPTTLVPHCSLGINEVMLRDTALQGLAVLSFMPTHFLLALLTRDQFGSRRIKSLQYHGTSPVKDFAMSSYPWELTLPLMVPMLAGMQMYLMLK